MILYTCAGGSIVLPDMPLVDRADGGNLIVNPPREVWERSELTAEELTQWSFLIAATGRAMLDVLPQLAGGCINYWEAGNWALNIAAHPPGVVKTAPEHRRVHMHLLGRSPRAQHRSWQWGEAPQFPPFAERVAWASSFAPLTDAECRAVVGRAVEVLEEKWWR